MSGISGVLFDLDGVFYVRDNLIKGALEAVEVLTEAKIPFRCLSNTTRKSSASVAEKLESLGFSIPGSHIITPAVAASEMLSSQGVRKCFFMITGNVSDDFLSKGIVHDEENPEAVVAGDAGDNFNYGSLNKAFRLLNRGIPFYALEKDKYWMDSDGLSLSAGPFVKGLEYASGVEAVLVGKPSPDYFNAALASMEKKPEDVMMIGDDINTDVGGSQNAGMKGVLVKTGKFSGDRFLKSGVTPDGIIDSVADLPKFLGIE
ncbi:HAD superfamily hydrolase (TIGR01458 family) [Methanomicrobium sp. W14]|uniref:TIGR01458 family HAD-type hydrolase n=1 Tax=Methanomicrobium sp. W14 TaxID=2817839 RepID=UPI001AE66387|nr:TIGR01458 family HAD-type hydrolase [Methanomicrobium sp. W14]MBP2132539.1 HAD superfamily hydrolase (TIGR01458 family) [Methanomicrobium sp. W14]